MALATISGVALAPGVSRNRRLYTPELIAKAAKRMQERLADPEGLPIVMRTHHDAGDDSAKIVGRVTQVTVDNNKALRYKADLYDTFHAREIANLVTPQQPALRSVSIHGYWMGDTKQIQTDEGLATTAEDLEIDAIDFTASPGVDGALIDGSNKATESGGVLRTPISESMEARVTMTEEGTGWVDTSKGVKEWHVKRGVQYEGDLKEYWVQEAKYSADDMKALLAKGHAMKNASGEPSYPIADISDLKKAIKAVGRGKAGHDAIRRHIIKRAKALGASNLIPDNWSSSGSNKETDVRLSDVKEYYPDGPSGAAGFCIDAYAGPLSVTIRGCVPPDELRAAAQMAACAAMDAINCMDPDNDADIDVMDDDTMGEQGTGFASGVVPDDDMRDKYSESAVSHGIEMEGTVLTDKDLLENIQQQLKIMNQRQDLLLKEAAAVNGVVGKPDDEAAAVNGVEGSPAVEGHMHSHDMAEDTTHTHGHLHTHETAGGSYDHSHGHSHFHLPGADGDHTHGHMHDHSTAPGDTYESATNKESAVSDTQKAAEAAPTTLTEADLTALGTTIGNTLAEALRAFAEMNTPKHAAAPQETAEKAEDVAESAASATVKADDLAALKESLANELRRDIRNELRAEILEEKGLPPRRGYRLTENDEPEEMTDAELFNKHRVDILLGQYAATPSPADDSQAA
jgi:hypothetical protein